jgi:hypothetical protein
MPSAGPIPNRAQVARRILLAIAASLLLALSIAPAAVGLTSAPANTAFGAGVAAHGSIGLGNITITNIAGNQVTLQTGGGWIKVVDASAVTIKRDGKTITVADLHVGDRVAIRQARNASGVVVITQLQVVLQRVHGVVATVGANFFTVRLKDGSIRTVTFTGTTTFRLGKAAATSGALAVGLNVSARGTMVGSVLAATTVQLTQAVTAGKVTAATASTITIQRGKKVTVTIHITGATTYTTPGGAAAALANVTAGSRIDATGTWAADGSFNATNIRVHGTKSNGAQNNHKNDKDKKVVKVAKAVAAQVHALKTGALGGSARAHARGR